jgi:tRNA(Ile)-lysidine synthetase-like protein
MPINHFINFIIKMTTFSEFFLSHPNLWFNATVDDDRQITALFKHLILSDYQLNTLPILDQILIYDQLSRHMKRENLIIDTGPYDAMALHLVQENIGDIEKYSPIERCFFLMPLRHTFNSKMIEDIVLKMVLQWRLDGDTPEYRRFYQASLNSLIKLKRTVEVEPRREQLLAEIFDPRSPIGIDQISTVYCEIGKITHNNVIVSLSGGVDSMLSLKLLHQIAQYRSEMNLIAVHINYGNRESSDEEEEVCRHYCYQLGVKLYVRHITEIKRDRSFDRDFYEEITRQIRFNSYKEFEGYVVVLGHNRDDSLENVFSNIIKQKHYENLMGMNSESEENGVIILRPLLRMSKSTIVDLAIKNGIPFVYDSTPAWSDRGKMRDQLIPHLREFNPNILEGLINMAEQYREIYQIAEKSIDNIVLEYGDGYVIFEQSDVHGMYYWKKIFYKITSYFEIQMISNRSIKNFMSKYGIVSQIHLSKNLCVNGNRVIYKKI